MRINDIKISVDFNSRAQSIEICALYNGQSIGGLYLNQDYDEESSMNYIPEDDDDDEIPEPEPFINLQLLEVDANYRQNGIATMLMNYFFDNSIWQLLEADNKYIKLDVHPQGLGITKQILMMFYSQYGFEQSYGNYMIREL